MPHYMTFLYKRNLYLLNCNQFAFYIITVFGFKNKLHQKNQA